MNDVEKAILSVLKTLKINKSKITDISVGWKNKDKEEPKVIYMSTDMEDVTEPIEYLKIEIYLKCPLK